MADIEAKREQANLDVLRLEFDHLKTRIEALELALAELRQKQHEIDEQIERFSVNLLEP